MRNRVLIDTGPLVACINRRDKFHSWACERLGEISPPILTCEAVLAEACFLIKDTPSGTTAVLDLVERGVLLIDFQVSTYTKSIRTLMEKYSSVPMSLADACLVKMTELHENSVVMTLDGDFRIYRRNGRQTIPVLMPSELC